MLLEVRTTWTTFESNLGIRRRRSGFPITPDVIASDVITNEKNLRKESPS
jgi:hypothetical protein